MSILRVGITYVTFSRDLEFLRESLRSCKKYARGFCGITIVVPNNDIDLFLPFERDFSAPECPVLVRTFMEYPGKGFVHHAAMICCSDIFSSGWTHTLHMDPDCLFTSPVTPLDYFVDGKPVLLIEPFDAIKRDGHAGRYLWKACAEDALKFECTHETMCRHPAVHHHWLYKEMRNHVEKQHGTPFIDYVLKQRNQFPQSFCEFGTLGAYALKMFPDSYHFIDRGFDREKNDPVSLVWQGWSYNGVTAQREMINKILS